MADMWMVRAGSDSFLIDEFKQKNLVAIGWNVGDLSNKSLDEIKELFYKKYGSDNSAGQSYKFVNELKIDDYVITFDSENRTYVLGKIVSDYYRSKKVTKTDISEDTYFDVRDVEWLCEIQRDQLKKSTQSNLNGRTTVFYINEDAQKDILNVCKGINIPNGKIWSMNVSRSSDYEEAWNLFKNNSCVSIDYFLKNIDNDYSSFRNKEDIQKFLKENIHEGSIEPDLINRFVNKVKTGDIFIAHKGKAALCGIGVVSSDYIYQNDVLKHIRKINWFYTPDDMLLKEGSFFKTSNIVRLDEEYPRFVNEIFARIAGKDKKVQKNLLYYLFNQYYENFHMTETGMNHFNAYSEEKEYIQHCWDIIKEKNSRNEDFDDIIWEDIFKRDVGVFTVGARDLKNLIKAKTGFTDEDMNQAAVLFYNTINDVLSTSDKDGQRIILKNFSNNKLSNNLGVGRFSPVLYYLKDSFYPINNKTILTFKFLSLALGDEIELSGRLDDYIDDNEKYKEFLSKLSNTIVFDKVDIGDVKIFDEFCHWICAVADYLWSKNAKILPFSILIDEGRETKMFDSDEKRNIIYFGAPGTGKSYNLNIDKDNLLKNYDDNYERVTFHPDYSYANFVGTYKPVPKDDSITYEYVPGPFMRVLKKAINNPAEPFLLIIEEINRANVAAVFGDVFQLLDRNKNNESVYPIDTTEDMKSFINQDKIKIPHNMFIWATMNSADQGVFPMDTAFKRRWDFKYFSINNDEKLIENTRTTLNNIEVNWNLLRKAINDELLSYKINEDKLMGPFFAFNEFMNQEIPTETFKDIFKNKIIMYLFEDAARSKRNDLFSGAKSKDYVTYSGICDVFDEKGVEIFCESIKSKFISDDE